MLLSNNRRVLVSAVIISALLNAIGQVLFKTARALHSDATLLSIFGYIETWAGLSVYGVSASFWLWVLARAQLSFAYPILALTFPIVVGASALLFSESILPLRWMGVGMVMFGVSLLART
jgi:drug/metabolite transporter (DMT)-like permease